MSADVADGDTEPDALANVPAASSKWKTATYVSSMMVQKMQPMIDGAVREIVRQVRYDTETTLPGFVRTRLADPFIALSNCVAEETLFSRGVDEIVKVVQSQESSSSSTSAAAAAAEKRDKHRSLRRALTGKIKPASLNSSGSTPIGESTMVEDPAKQYAAQLDLQRQITEHIVVEARRVSLRLVRVVELFVDQLCAIAGVRYEQYRRDLLTFAPYVMVHPSVARHPRLEKLRLGDNTLVLELGRTAMRQFVLMETYAQASHVENAERRCRELYRNAHVWLADRCAPAVIPDIMPVDWYLDPLTHENLSAITLDERRDTMRNELPFMMIGVLQMLRLDDEAERVMWSIYTKLL